MWQFCDDGVRRSWTEALKHVEDLTLAGYDDWRLPNVMELYSIVDIGTTSPAVNNDFFDLSSQSYWTSSTCFFDSNRAWTVHFTHGQVLCIDKGFLSAGAFHLATLAVRDLE